MLMVSAVFANGAVVKNNANDGYMTSASEDQIPGSTRDGHIFAYSSSYTGARNADSGTVFDTATNYSVGQMFIYPGLYFIYRTFVYFDTSSIPAGARIDSATLKLCCKWKSSQYQNFEVVVQNGQPTYPHNPMCSTDYSKDHYSGNGGSLDYDDFITTTHGVYSDIPLNSNGRSWIKTGSGAVTKLCLRSSNDIDNEPIGSGSTCKDSVGFYSCEASYPPILVVEYTVENNDPDFSFIHITDLHFHASQDDMKTWLGIVNSIKEMDPVPSFVLCTGDIADAGSCMAGRSTYRVFIKTLDKSGGNWYLKDTSIPIFFCPGNHDAYKATGITGDFDNYVDYIGDPYGDLYYTRSINIQGHSIKIFSLNSGKDTDFGDTMPNGDGLYQSDINNFVNDVQSSSDLKIVLTHHPYVLPGPSYDGTFDNCRTPFINACNSYNVDLVFSGHTHSGTWNPMTENGNNIWTENGGKFIIASSDPTAFVITDSIGGFKETGEKPTCRIVDVYPNGDIAVHIEQNIKAFVRSTPFIDFLNLHPRLFPLLRVLAVSYTHLTLPTN